MNTRRPGFTLFQLLIVLAVLAILFALLLPAVAKVRMAAARTQSANNLKQLALACHNYHDVNGHFPTGLDGKGFSASAYLLPYIEQDNLFKTIDFTKPADDKANATARKAVVKVFLNPADPVPLMADNAGPTNYLFSAGSKPALEDNDGVFYKDSKLKIAAITDGTSNTLMIGETLRGDGGVKATDVRRQHVVLKEKDLKAITDEEVDKAWKDGKNIAADRGFRWIDGHFLQGTFTATRGMNDPKPDVSCGGAGGLSALRNLSGASNTAFCDGSVHFIKDTIKPESLQHLATRNGGEVIANDDF